MTTSAPYKAIEVKKQSLQPAENSQAKRSVGLVLERSSYPGRILSTNPVSSTTDSEEDYTSFWM